MEDKYLKPEVKVLKLTSLPCLCEASPAPGGSESVGYENWLY